MHPIIDRHPHPHTHPHTHTHTLQNDTRSALWNTHSHSYLNQKKHKNNEKWHNIPFMRGCAKPGVSCGTHSKQSCFLDSWLWWPPSSRPVSDRWDRSGKPPPRKRRPHYSDWQSLWCPPVETETRTFAQIVFKNSPSEWHEVLISPIQNRASLRGLLSKLCQKPWVACKPTRYEKNINTEEKVPIVKLWRD